MPADLIRDLWAYTDWANARVLDAAGGLSDEQWRRDLGSSFPSIHATLVHMLGAEWIWLERWNGRSPSTFPSVAELVDAAAVRRRWTEVETERAAFLRALDEPALERIVEYRTMRGDPFAAPLRELLLHVVNHATYHRGQVVAMMRQVGAPGVATDLVLFHRERALAD